MGHCDVRRSRLLHHANISPIPDLIVRRAGRLTSLTSGQDRTDLGRTLARASVNAFQLGPRAVAAIGVAAVIIGLVQVPVPQVVYGGVPTNALREPLHPENVPGMDAPDHDERKPAAGATQSLSRAIDIIEAVAEGPVLLPQLASRLGLSTSTTYRLAQALAERGLLAFTPRLGYRIGKRLKELGSAYLDD